MTYHENRSSAYQAARRTLKARFGKQYLPKIGIDFIVCQSTYGEYYGLWRYDLMV